MLIAVDYDQTYTKDPGLWEHFIIDAIARAHECVLVTVRHKREKLDIPHTIYYTCHENKVEFMRELDLYVDIWC